MMLNQPLERTIGREGPNELARLESQLRFHLRGYVCDFRMILQNDGWVLYGCARTYYAKQMAQHGVMKRSNLPIRANRINVL